MKNLGIVFLVASLVVFILTFVPLTIHIAQIGTHVTLLAATLLFVFGYLLTKASAVGTAARKTAVEGGSSIEKLAEWVVRTATLLSLGITLRFFSWVFKDSEQ